MCRVAGATHGIGGQANGGERSEPPGKGRAASEASGGAKDARPKGGDRVLSARLIRGGCVGLINSDRGRIVHIL